MWQTVTKQGFGYLRSIIVLSALLLTLNLIVLFGEASFMYMYLQKQFSCTLENYTPFLVYTTLIHGKIFAFLSVIENFGILLYSPMYTAAYVTAIHDFANCFFFLSAILGTFVFVLFGTISFLLSRSTITDDLLVENQF